MSLGPGSRLGPYEVLSALGAGGMGEVYRARDTKLGRDVAIKVLPLSVTRDPDRLARFAREAQVLAALNCPTVAAIYHVEDTGESPAIVMEFVDGETLADRIARGPLPLEEALPVAKQIAEALEAAHDQGIIHRDLKPANVKVRPDGSVKVLDFGLAKLNDVDVATTSSAMSMSPTITSPALMTSVGVLLGTAAYMAPEQARGKLVDRRADLWAFGCILFEMLTGKRAFAGDDVTDTIVAVISKTPDWTALPASTPAGVLRLLRRCLEKDRKRRLADAADARIEIEDVSASPESSSSTANRSTHKLLWLLAAASLTIAAAGLGYALTSSEDQPPIVRFQVHPPDGWSVADISAVAGAAPAPIAVAPDGRRLAFMGRTESGDFAVWIQPFDAVTAQQLAGTEGASSPFWSPDSRFLAFFAGGKLKKIDTAGGPPVTLADAQAERSGSWNRDGDIIFVPMPTSPVQRISDAGGTPVPVTKIGDGETGHSRPTFLPDGRHFAYRAYTGGREGPIYIGSLDSSERTLLLTSDASNIAVTREHVLFLRNTTLMAQRLNPSFTGVAGDAFPIAEHVQAQGNPLVGVFSASEDGVIGYKAGTGIIGTELAWFDRMGKRLGGLGDVDSYGDIEFSPDGGRAMVTVADPVRGTRDLWIYDLNRQIRSRLTFDPAQEIFPAWFPDGNRVVFSSNRQQGNEDLYERAVNGTGEDRLLLRAPGTQRPFSVSHDGRHLLYESGQPVEIWNLPLLGAATPSLLVKGPGTNVSRPKFSPDDRWVLYNSAESGRTEIYVTSFPKADGKWQVSTNGGQWARWSTSSREIYYLAPDNQMMVADVSGDGAAFEVRGVRPMFATRTTLNQRFSYDVSPDGKRFLINTLLSENADAPITVVMNWRPPQPN